MHHRLTSCLSHEMLRLCHSQCVGGKRTKQLIFRTKSYAIQGTPIYLNILPVANAIQTSDAGTVSFNVQARSGTHHCTDKYHALN